MKAITSSAVVVQHSIYLPRDGFGTKVRHIRTLALRDEGGAHAQQQGAIFVLRTALTMK